MEKQCPQCAEFVKEEARKCRYCQHTFGYNRYQSYVIALLLFFIIFLLYSENKLRHAKTYYKDFDVKTSGLVVENFTITKNPKLKILGQIKNNGADTWKYISVQAKFYDKNGKVVDLVDTHSSAPLKPGDVNDFKIDRNCSNNKENIAFDNVTLSVTSASYVSED